MTILGTRPEIIRLSLIIPHLDRLCDHVLVHTGQNYAHTLNELFFDELAVRKPDYFLNCEAKTPMAQVGQIVTACEEVIVKEKPDRVLILGDTNSGLSAIVAKRLGIPVFHMEAGNRCYDDRVPEEVNRRVIDHSSDILMPYTERSRANLLREGIEGRRVYVTGNPIKQVLDYYQDKIAASNVLESLGLAAQKYFLVTLHRAENVDIEDRLKQLIKGLQLVHSEYKVPVICSLHPRTRSQLEKHTMVIDGAGIQAIEAFGLIDFVHLEKHALCVLTDSGTVQEECSIFQVPNVTLRDVTERPETIEVGSNILSGADPESVVNCVRAVLDQPPAWVPPQEYLAPDVVGTVIKITLGYLGR